MDYKKYSLENLNNWLHDAINCEEISPQEIYNTIKSTVSESYYYHKNETYRCYQLLSLLNGFQLQDDAMKNNKVTKWILPVLQKIEDGVDDYFIHLPDDLLEEANLKKGDQVEWVDNHDGSYTMKKREKDL